MINIAVDAMGGDKAPSIVVKGAVQASLEAQGRFSIILTGPEGLITRELEKNQYNGDRIKIIDAPETVNMDDVPTEVLKAKKESGLVKCVAIQKAGRAHASISAGNSGAMMAACLMILGRVGKILRPAITIPVPVPENKTLVLLDCGGNLDEKPINLLQFAICGSVYAEHVLHYSSPKVALLNIGEEEKKGPELQQETFKLLKDSPLNFIGNIEGRDLFSRAADVVVTPGFTGNVLLKTMEGFYEMHNRLFGSIESPQGQWFHKEWNYSNKGGALLLGLNGIGVITHGRAEAITIKNAIITAYEMASNRVAENIGKKLGELE